MEGYDETHLIKNVKFLNCYNDGKKISEMNQIKAKYYFEVL